MKRDVTLSRPSSAYWDQVGSEWVAHNHHTFWRAYRDAHISELVDRWLPQDDLGCVLKTDAFDEAVAEGLYPLFRRRARKVIGIDVSPVVVNGARQRYPDFDVLVADVRSLPFEDNRFDTIVSFSTLDHFDTVEDIEAAFRALHRVLVPEGRLLLTLDNETNPLVWVRNHLPYGLLHGLGLVPYQVGKTLRAGSLTRRLTACGYQVQTISHVLHCPRAVAVKAASIVDRFSGERGQTRLHRWLKRFEILEGWPTRAMTGYYVAVLAEKQ